MRNLTIDRTYMYKISALALSVLCLILTSLSYSLSFCIFMLVCAFMSLLLSVVLWALLHELQEAKLSLG